MQCTKCNSDNTQRLEVVFENSTQNTNTNSHSAGAGFGGSFGVGGVITKTSGISQSLVGGKAAPPMQKSYKWAIIGGLISTMFMGQILVGGTMFAVCAYFGYRAFTYNNTDWPPLHHSYIPPSVKQGTKKNILGMKGSYKTGLGKIKTVTDSKIQLIYFIVNSTLINKSAGARLLWGTRDFLKWPP